MSQSLNSVSAMLFCLHVLPNVKQDISGSFFIFVPSFCQHKKLCFGMLFRSYAYISKAVYDKPF